MFHPRSVDSLMFGISKNKDNYISVQLFITVPFDDKVKAYTHHV